MSFPMVSYIVFLDSIHGSDQATIWARVDAVLRSFGDDVVPTEVFDIASGGLVIPYVAGAADPFALRA